MEIRMAPRLEQRLKMAPQIIQSIEILQLPLLALQERIEQEQLENPLLEIEDLTDTKTLSEDAQPLTRAEQTEQDDDFHRVREVSDDFHDYFSQTTTRQSVNRDKDEKLEALQNSPGPGPTLRDHLAEQLRFLEVKPRLRELTDALINNLDRDGRLCFPLDEIAASLDDPPTAEEAEEALRLVQSLDPAGVGARDLTECLLLQLDRNDPEYPLHRTLILNHLHDIEANRFPYIAKRAARDLEHVKQAIGVVCMLNPAPGRLHDNEIVPTIVPDVHVELTDGQYEVRLDNHALPRVRISPEYRQIMQLESSGSDTRKFLQKKMESARWLIDSIQQRRRTILRVSREVVKAQQEFLAHGLSRLKPLKMQEVADAIEMHVATVSRAIRHKYMQTPRGLVAMKFFFTGGTTSDDGDVQTWDAVREKIKQIIAAEDKRSPLSDEDIVKALAADGTNIARRTVTKYRKALNIPTSRQRKLY